MKYTIIDGELYRTDELYHHGVKGMRWGVRKERKHRSRAERIKERTEVRQAREVDRQARAAAKQAKMASKIQTHHLKNELLKKTNERLQAEKTRRELSVKMTKKDRKLIAKIKAETAVAAAKADKLQAENRMKDERKKAQGVIQKGKFFDEKGNFIAFHEGYPFYTIGQRRGLGIDLNRAVFVKEIIPQENKVILGDLQSLEKTEMVLKDWNITNPEALLGRDDVIVKIRYRKQANRCTVTLRSDNTLHVQLHEPLTAIMSCWVGELFSDVRGENKIIHSGVRNKR